mgnify:CR=1 FL=1
MVSYDLAETPLNLTELSVDITMPTSRYYHSMTVVSGYFFMYGGSDGNNVIDQLWVYDQHRETWTL